MRIAAAATPERAIVVCRDMRGGGYQWHRLELALVELMDGAGGVAGPDLILRADRDLAEAGGMCGDGRKRAASPLRELLRVVLTDGEHRAVLADANRDGIAGLLRPPGAV